MLKTILFALFSLLTVQVNAQSLNGTYQAFELNGLKIDSLGELYFYGIEAHPKVRWYHEVIVTIKGSSIDIKKSPVYFDSTGEMFSSASDGGFLTYSGKLIKSNSLYVAQTKLIAHDYVAWAALTDSTMLPPDYEEKAETAEAENDLNFDSMVEISNVKGEQVLIQKDLLTIDYVIRKAGNDLLINNQRYKKVK